jgi:predicted molibdopterin-dependent oxidoreductase YjgC
LPPIFSHGISVAMLTRSEQGSLILYFAGRAVTAREGDSVAAALLAAGIQVFRTTSISGAPRGPFCMMGACFECLAEVDGRSGVQTCMTPARHGMHIEPRDGARGI